MSHAYRDDGPKQGAIHGHLPNGLSRFSASAHPTHGATGRPDNTMRGRSLNFLAFATVAASALRESRGASDVNVFVPENGLIALNPPATDGGSGP